MLGLYVILVIPLSIVSALVFLFSIRLFRARRRKKLLSSLVEILDVVSNQTAISDIAVDEWKKGLLRFKGVQDVCFAKVSENGIDLKLPATYLNDTLHLNWRKIKNLKHEMIQDYSLEFTIISFVDNNISPLRIPWNENFVKEFDKQNT